MHVHSHTHVYVYTHTHVTHTHTGISSHKLYFSTGIVPIFLKRSLSHGNNKKLVTQSVCGRGRL